MSALLPANFVIEAERAASICGTLGSIDWAAAKAAFEGQDPRVKIDTGLLVAEDIAKIVGLFIPEAATAAEWIEVARIALPIFMAIVNKLPPAAQPGPNEIVVWGHIMSNKGIFQ